MSVWPIIICSKGRPETCRVPEDLPVILLVEPSESEAYANVIAAHGTQDLISLAILTEDDQGIAYARNQALHMARLRQYEWFWMLDDDISAYAVTDGGKNVRVNAAQALQRAQEALRAYPDAGQIALEYQQYAWSSKSRWKLNSYADVAVAIHVASAPRYRPEANMKEDRDFTLQVIASGRPVVRDAMTSFAAPKNGSNVGGLWPDYHTEGRERGASEALAALWPGIVSVITKRDGRVDAKVNWSAFKIR